jgi:hypothetical protein
MIRSLLVFTLLGCVAVTQLVAQESRGAISGRLLDPTGASIPGATVIIRNTETNSVSRSATNATGYFEVILLNPGLYSVEAEAKGFKRLVSRLSWKWRERSTAKITERTREETTKVLHR